VVIPAGARISVENKVLMAGETPVDFGYGR
jgi:hypothetical protein